MLVISRKKNETIVIGEEIEITVVEIRGDKVRLGVNTPREMPVHRQEVYEAIRRESARWNAPAAELEPPAIHAPSVAVQSPPTVAASPANVTLSGQAVAHLDLLRGSSELSREETLETMLSVVNQAKVQSLCELERRLGD